MRKSGPDGRALLRDTALPVLDHPLVRALDQDYDAAIQEMEIASTVRAMIERSRFIDQALERAAERGIMQYLIVGAGFDTHAWRYRDLLAAGRASSNSTRPEMTALKRQLADAALGGSPSNLVYVPADLERESMRDPLLRHGYDLSQPTFIIMEGVTMYVREDALRATLRFFAAHAPGSSIVLDFCTQAMVDGINALDPAQLPPDARPPLQRLLDLLRQRSLGCLALPSMQSASSSPVRGWSCGSCSRSAAKSRSGRFLTRADGSTVAAETHAKAEAYRRSMQERMLAMMDPAQRTEAQFEDA